MSVWGIALGRRFRALKLWFVIRNFGVEGIKERIRNQIDMAKDLSQTIKKNPDFEMLSHTNFNLICFRYHPKGITNEMKLDHINEKLLHQINSSGKAFLSHTKVHGKYCLRMVIAQTYVEKRHVDKAWKLIKELSSEIKL